MYRLMLLLLLSGVTACAPIVVERRAAPPAAYPAAPVVYQPAPAPQGPPPPVVYSPAPVPAYPPPVAALDDGTIVLVFVDVLGRDPSQEELRSYRDRARTRRWGAEELRLDLRGTDECRQLTPELVIRRAWHEQFGGEPDNESMRRYRQCIVEQGWTPGRVRQAIRESEGFRARNANAVIERAHREVLERAPDPTGREHYRRLLQQGWSDEQVRADLRQSVEYRVDLPDSKTKRAYQKILGREADPSGIESYRKKLVDKGWTERDVENDLRRSAEFRNRSIDDVVRRVYRDVYRRDPDPDSLARYARLMREQNWTEGQLRDELAKAAGGSNQDSGDRNRRR